MDMYHITLAVFTCLLLCFGLMLTDDATAQDSVAEREGLQAREIDAEKLPGRLEIGLAIGSTIAMVLVYKYL